MVVARVRQVAERIHAVIEGTGRHFVQQRFPQMAVVAIHQRDLRFVLAAKFMAQAGRQLQATGAAANNNDFLLWRCQNNP